MAEAVEPPRRRLLPPLPWLLVVLLRRNPYDCFCCHADECVEDEEDEDDNDDDARAFVCVCARM